MKVIAHPSTSLAAGTISTIRGFTVEAELNGQLLPAQLELIRQHKWFHLFVPAQYGGLGLSLPDVVRLEESLAWADGSLGWTVTLCAGAAMFVGYLEDGMAKQIFENPAACLAGSGKANGIAHIIDGGYEVNGDWPYASGAPHATFFTANCLIYKDGEPITDLYDVPEIRSFLFKNDEVVLHANWQYIGLNATAGHSYSVSQLYVPAERSFVIAPHEAKLPDAVYRYPFLQLAETTIAANLSGIAIAFIDYGKTLLEEKEPSYPRAEKVKNLGLALVAQAQAEIDTARSTFYEALQTSWHAHEIVGELPTHLLEAVTNSSLQLAERARFWVDKLYPYFGLDAARTDTPINQVWRNMHTASQHSLLLNGE